MQRLRTHEGEAQLTDELDVITITQLDGYLGVRRNESVLGSNGRSEFVVEGDNVAELAEWFSQIADEPSVDADASTTESQLLEHNTAYNRVAAIVMADSVESEAELEAALATVDVDSELSEAIEDLVAESRKLIEQVGGAFDFIRGNAAHWTSGKLTKATTEAGLIVPDNYHALLLGAHSKGGTKETLVVDTARYARIPVERAREFGSWVLAGRTELKKKSIWG